MSYRSDFKNKAIIAKGRLAGDAQKADLDRFVREGKKYENKKTQ